METVNFASIWRWYFYIIVFYVSSSVFALPKLILISMDGFRYDYLDLIPPEEIEHFQFMMKNGVTAKSIMNVFPSVTYPNHYTILTGLYPESHGIVHNRFFDSTWNEYFMYTDRRDNVDPFWYDVGAEPIYVTNKRAGGFSGSVVWPSGTGEVKGVKPDRLIPNANWFTEMNSTYRVDTLISWFTDPDHPINLGLLYFPEPDEIAHATGAGSKNVTDYIKGDLNDAIGYLIRRLKEVDLYNDMNFILTSDHGLGNYNKSKSVLLNDYLNSSWYKTGSEDFSENGNRICVNIFPEKGKEDEIVRALHDVKYLNVYKAGDDYLVNTLHYNASDRIAPIVITASEEGVLIFPTEADKVKHTSVGVHGYDPHIVQNMRPFFIAMGPAFKEGYVSEQFNSVDIYPLMCHILGVDPAPNNGSFKNVKDLLREQISYTKVAIVIVIAVCVIMAAIYVICVIYHARNKTDAASFDCFSSSTDICNAEIPEIPNLSTRDPTFVLTNKTSQFSFCDVYSIATHQWYKSEAHISTYCPSMYSCGAKFPIWMNGQNPEQEEGVVNRTSCVRDFDSCCLITYKLTSVNCRDFMAYCFIDLPTSCHQRYCFETGHSSTVEPQQTNEQPTNIPDKHVSSTNSLPRETDTSTNGHAPLASSPVIEHSFKNALDEIPVQLTIALSVIGLCMIVICGLLFVIIHNKRAAKIADEPEKIKVYETLDGPGDNASENIYQVLSLDILDKGKLGGGYYKTDFINI